MFCYDHYHWCMKAHKDFWLSGKPDDDKEITAGWLGTPHWHFYSLLKQGLWLGATCVSQSLVGRPQTHLRSHGGPNAGPPGRVFNPALPGSGGTSSSQCLQRTPAPCAMSRVVPGKKHLWERIVGSPRATQSCTFRFIFCHKCMCASLPM